jgi:hypothetical protein
MRSKPISLALLVGACTACATRPDLSAAPRWAINWAEVTPSASGLEGYQVWEFFVDGWEKEHDESFFKCYIARRLEGEVVRTPEGCEGCTSAYELEFLPYVGAGRDASEGVSCNAELQDDARFEGPLSYGVGLLPDDLGGEAPFPGKTSGWYIGWDGRTVEPFGYAYAKALEEGAQPSGPGWVNGETYVLWPAYAWDLGA